MQVEQDEIHLAVFVHQLLQTLERTGLEEAGFTLFRLKRLLDGGAEKRVIVGDDHRFGLDCEQAVHAAIFPVSIHKDQ